jgi:hypothetical protein
VGPTLHVSTSARHMGWTLAVQKYPKGTLTPALSSGAVWRAASTRTVAAPWWGIMRSTAGGCSARGRAPSGLPALLHPAALPPAPHQAAQPAPPLPGALPVAPRLAALPTRRQLAALPTHHQPAGLPTHQRPADLRPHLHRVLSVSRRDPLPQQAVGQPQELGRKPWRRIPARGPSGHATYA